ncbi:MAG: helix-turn-helix transcriptional regulator [Hyphomicrobium sp.]
MRKVTPIGCKIKELRELQDRCSTQKEFAYAVGISERMLRKIENENALLSVGILERIAQLLGVPHSQLAFSLKGPQAVPLLEVPDLCEALDFSKDRLIPRFEDYLAYACMDEGKLYEEVRNSDDIKTVVKTSLNDETEAYVQELVEILGSLTRDHRFAVPPPVAIDEGPTKRRIRQIMVLLKGNDIWLYEADVMRRLPERDTLDSDDENCAWSCRKMVVFGPPGEYGETSIDVEVDNGRPYILKGFPEARAS